MQKYKIAWKISIRQEMQYIMKHKENDDDVQILILTKIIANKE